MYFFINIKKISYYSLVKGGSIDPFSSIWILESIVNGPTQPWTCKVTLIPFVRCIPSHVISQKIIVIHWLDL